ncbi:YiiX/YebB-like N1pC/P60 family cysteine hydrolase [Aquibium sp. A9E412]|uniref:YiiX/YebB-like N1pC/P60 family cysteine hydrolase n=1 Tax=Aquibium sp. A9E412 TaxID=2976767 RepID=UPI0025AEEB6A|nr:YiiX/YebB-like N1pC/P60 family cysteine hydrolase [Aquibium sp. A9E412]MDN2566847.1 YiiX/YebB-like N1pC/P60 family cysteine hydrolase [Aquibium sp. A9E412]
MTRHRGRIALLLAAAIGLGGCAQTRAPDGGGQAGACCERAERYPAWLVALAEPAAPLIGRAIAQVRLRQGHLPAHPEALALVEKTLRPADLVVVSAKNRLSGRTIPGLFGHAAIYVGDEAQLRALGLWRHPAIVPHHAAIRAGASFVEADQKGVHLSPPDVVLDVDGLVVLRPAGYGAAGRRRAVAGYFGFLGERFDFHFDSADDGAVFCTELVATVAPDLRLPVRLVYGRQTILPDEVALGAARGTIGLGPVLYVSSDARDWQRRSAAQLAADLEAHWQGPLPAPARPAGCPGR